MRVFLGGNRSSGVSLALVAVATTSALVLAACGSSTSESTSSAASVAPAASEAPAASAAASEAPAASAAAGAGAAALGLTGGANLPKTGEVAMFGQSRENPYFGKNADGARKVVEALGWTMSYVEATSQEEQDAAIQQMLAQPEKPIGVILNPISVAAAVGSMKAIKAAGIPLTLLNQAPPTDQGDLFDAYGGVNDVLSGETAAHLLIDGAKKAGVTLGDGLIVNTVAGHKAAEDRVAGFTSVMQQELPESKVLSNSNSGGYLEAEGYDIGSQIVPANKGKFNWVYGVNDALAVGAMQAAQENGITPGKDALFVGGTCMNKNTNQAVLDGLLVGTAVQSPEVEGESAAIALAQFINTGKVQEGDTNLDPAAPPSLDDAPFKYNWMPNPMVENNQASYDTVSIWGQTAQVLCNHSG